MAFTIIFPGASLGWIPEWHCTQENFLTVAWNPVFEISPWHDAQEAVLTGSVLFMCLAISVTPLWQAAQLSFPCFVWEKYWRYSGLEWQVIQLGPAASFAVAAFSEEEGGRAAVFGLLPSAAGAFSVAVLPRFSAALPASGFGAKLRGSSGDGVTLPNWWQLEHMNSDFLCWKWQRRQSTSVPKCEL